MKTRTQDSAKKRGASKIEPDHQSEETAAPGEREPESSADEVSPDGVDGTQTPATRKVGDIDEMAAHGPDGDGSIDTAAGDAQGIPKLPS